MVMNQKKRSRRCKKRSETLALKALLETSCSPTVLLWPKCVWHSDFTAWRSTLTAHILYMDWHLQNEYQDLHVFPHRQSDSNFLTLWNEISHASGKRFLKGSLGSSQWNPLLYETTFCPFVKVLHRILKCFHRVTK